MDSQALRTLVGFQRNWLAIQGWTILAFPMFDRQYVLLRPAGLVIGGGSTVELARAQIET